MLRENTMVLITTHNAVGSVIYTGDARIDKVNKNKHGIEYVVKCSDGITRSVAQGDKRYAKDSIMEL